MSGTAIQLVVKSRRRMVRDAICAYVASQPDFQVVGQTGSIDELAQLCVLCRPDAALVDAVQLTTQTVAALQQVREVAPTTEVVVTYSEVAPAAYDAAVRAGITALVPCSRGLDAVLRNVREYARPGDRRRPDGKALTEYDLRIMSLMSSGHSVAMMAELLQVSRRTVENHKRRLYVKLGVGSAGHAVARAASLGLIDVPSQQDQARPAEPGRTPLVVVLGPPGDTVDRVVCTLLAARLPVVHARTPAVSSQEHWFQWQRGPIIAVLVDPTASSWQLPVAITTHTMVVYSTDPALPTIVDALLRGAHAIVPDHDIAADLVRLLSIAIDGYVAVEAKYMQDVAGWMMVRVADGSPAMPELTTRELDILHSIAEGRTTRQTARDLGVATKTVENAQGHLFRKLAVHNRAEALTVAYRLGLLRSGVHQLGSSA